MTTPIDTEALVIGAGPVGLFQVFQLGLQGVHCHVVDALPHDECVGVSRQRTVHGLQ